MSEIYSLQVSNGLNDSHNFLLVPNRSKHERYFDDRMPEMYYLKSENDGKNPSNKSRRSSPESVNRNSNTHSMRAELYHIGTPETIIRKLPFTSEYGNTTTDIVQTSQSDRRTSSRPRIGKKKKLTVSFNLVPEYDEHNVSNKTSEIPVELSDISANIGFLPFAKSKATASIQRSMTKYRF